MCLFMEIQKIHSMRQQGVTGLIVLIMTRCRTNKHLTRLGLPSLVASTLPDRPVPVVPPVLPVPLVSQGSKAKPERMENPVPRVIQA